MESKSHGNRIIFFRFVSSFYTVDILMEFRALVVEVFVGKVVYQISRTIGTEN